MPLDTTKADAINLPGCVKGVQDFVATHNPSNTAAAVQAETTANQATFDAFVGKVGDAVGSINTAVAPAPATPPAQ